MSLGRIHELTDSFDQTDDSLLKRDSLFQPGLMDESTMSLQTKIQVNLNPGYLVSMVRPVVLSQYDKVDKMYQTYEKYHHYEKKQEHSFDKTAPSKITKIWKKPGIIRKDNSSLSVNTVTMIDLQKQRLQKLNQVVKKLPEE